MVWVDDLNFISFVKHIIKMCLLENIYPTYVYVSGMCMYNTYIYVCVCTMSVCSDAHRGQNRCQLSWNWPYL